MLKLNLPIKIKSTIFLILLLFSFVAYSSEKPVDSTLVLLSYVYKPLDNEHLSPLWKSMYGSENHGLIMLLKNPLATIEKFHPQQKEAMKFCELGGPRRKYLEILEERHTPLPLKKEETLKYIDFTLNTYNKEGLKEPKNLKELRKQIKNGSVTKQYNFAYLLSDGQPHEPSVNDVFIKYVGFYIKNQD